MENGKKARLLDRVPRALAGDKVYWLNQLEEFSAYWLAEYLEFGKQDSRGSPSICLFTARHTVKSQRHFANMTELLAFVQGYNKAKTGEQYL